MMLSLSCASRLLLQHLRYLEAHVRGLPPLWFSPPTAASLVSSEQDLGRPDQGHPDFDMKNFSIRSQRDRECFSKKTR